MRMKPGRFKIKLGDKSRSAHFQYECLVIVWEHCANVSPDVIPYLEKLHRPKVRLIAKVREDLNPGQPELSMNAIRVFGDYWLYKTRSGDKVVKLMDLACRVAGLQFQKDVVVDTAMFNFPNYRPNEPIDLDSLL